MDEAHRRPAIVPAAICLGIAGVDRPNDAAIVRGIMRRIGFNSRVLIVNDALIALETGAPGQPGVVIISGTGSIAYGRNAAGEAARSGGWGYVLGDEGSGYWIGRAALRAVLRAADHRGPATVLTPMLLDALQRAPAAAAAARGLPSAVEAGGDWRAGRSACSAAFLAGRRRPRSASCAAPPTSSRPARSRSRAASGCSPSRSVSSCRAGFSARCRGSSRSWRAGLPRSPPRSVVTRLDREPAEGAVTLALQEARGGAHIPVYKQ